MLMKEYELHPQATPVPFVWTPIAHFKSLSIEIELLVVKTSIIE